MTPAAGSLGFVRQHGSCAAVTADRRESLRVQRVDNNVVLSDVRFEVFVVEFRQWIDSNRVCFDVDCQNRADRSLTAIAAAQTSNERVVLTGYFREWLDLSGMAALFLPSGVRYSTPYFSVCSCIVSSG